MRFTASSFATLALAVSQALAEIVLTSPTGTTTCVGGQQCNVAWSAGPNPPTLQQCGSCSFSVFVGSQFQQSFLQLINPAVPVATTAGIVFTVDPTIGENSSSYFIRVQCPIQDPANPLIPYLAFSHMFALSGMSGHFNDTVKAQISATSAATSSAAAGAGASTGATASVTGSSSRTSPTPTGSKTASSTAKPSQTGAAVSNSVGSGVLLALAGSVFMFL